MREIKFRAWDEEEQEMLDWDKFFNFDIAQVFESEGSWGIYPMQYTGLKDKNGTEIYDGDYIRYSMRTINGSIYTHVCRVFQHESGTWRIEGYHEDNHSYETKGTVYAAHLICEVIGNIYENPELLKEEPTR